MAFRNKETVLVLPEGARPGEPRIIIDGDTGQIIVVGEDEADRLIINPTGAEGVAPVINLQSNETGAPDLQTGISYWPGIGPLFYGDTAISSENGILTRARMLLASAASIAMEQVRADNESVRNGGSFRAGLASAVMQYILNGVSQGSFSISNSGASIDVGDNPDPTVNVFGALNIQWIVGSIAESMLGKEAQTSGSVATGSATTSYIAGTTNLFLSFICPPSGAVLIGVSGGVGSDTATVARRAFASAEVREGNVAGAGTVMRAANDTDAMVYQNFYTGAGFKYGYGNNFWVVNEVADGLVPGDLYHARWMGRVDNAADSLAYHNRKLFVIPQLYSWTT